MNELESAKAYVEHSDKLTDRGRKHMKWLIKQSEKAELYEKALKRIIQQTQCDDTWDFANRVLEGKPNNDLFYRINIE